MAPKAVTPQQAKSLKEEFADLDWATIEADGVITLDEIVAEMETHGYPADSHDHLYDD